METIAFITLMALTLVVSAITEVLKKWKKIGSTGTQVLVLGFGVLIALVQYGFTFVPAEQAQVILTIMAGAIGWYELIVKRLETK
jgi:hypothetical protein